MEELNLFEDALREIALHQHEKYNDSDQDIEKSDTIFTKAIELEIIDEDWIDAHDRHTSIERYSSLVRAILLKVNGHWR
jgi:hypothetical protein